MTGRASPGVPTAPSSGTSAKARMCVVFGINTTMRKKKNPQTQIKFSQLCFFLFLFKPLGLCARCPPQMARGGVSQQDSGGDRLPIAFGDRGDRRRLWVGSSLAPRTRHCACAWGELLFGGSRRGGGSAGTHQGGLPKHLHPHPQPDYIHSIYTHTHSPAGRQSAPLFRFESQGSIMGITPAPQPLQKD